jgi:predicted nucleic acid-binding protein
VIVADASALAPALADDGSDGERARARLHGERLVAPELLVLEVASVIRRAHHTGRLEARRCQQALSDLRALPLRLAPHRPLLARIWELRENATVYDASYLALAELLAAPLITADQALARMPGIHCQVELLER